MAWTQLGPRKGARRLPEKKRRRILKRYPQCQLAIPGVCTGTSTQVHHLRDAADFDNPNDPRIDAEQIDGRPQLIGVCAPCHRHVSARRSAARSSALNGTRVLREKERHPGILE
jgi:5-methylcytosine-specific restriction protein A